MTISFTSDMAFNHLYLAVVTDDDLGLISEEEDQQTPRSQTPPTPDHHQPSPSPPRQIRQRAMAQLRPVSIPNLVSDMAGPDPFRYYMPDGHPAAETSSRGNSGVHQNYMSYSEHLCFHFQGNMHELEAILLLFP